MNRGVIKIRKSIPSDVYGIREVQREAWLKTYPNKEAGITIKDIEEVFENDNTSHAREGFEKRKERYKDKNIGIWVAEDGSRIIGFCTAVIEENCNRIVAIYVTPDYQKKGIGGLLIKKAFFWLGDKKDIFVNAVSYNQRAIGFYNRFGFEKTGRAGIFDKAARLPSGKTMPEIEMIKKSVLSTRPSFASPEPAGVGGLRSDELRQGKARRR